MSQSEDALRKLMERIARTQQRELDCGEVFAVLDQYTDAIVEGKDVSAEFTEVILHLELCPDCLEEYEALLSVIQTKH